MLDASTLKKALETLRVALDAYELEKDNLIIRDCCIQRFEYCYELSWKTLKRYLETVSADASQFDSMPFQTLIRTGFEYGLLKNSWEKWRLYREYRGATSHTYNEEKAQKVFNIIPEFYEDAFFLLGKLSEAGA